MTEKKKPIKILKQVLEIIWLIVALIALIIAIKETISTGINKSLMYYLFSGVASFFYFSRRNQRIKS